MSTRHAIIKLPLQPVGGEDWRQRAACRGMDTNSFYPERGGPQAQERAKAPCRGCPVVVACREFAIEHGERGIWGDTNDWERAALRRDRLRQAA